MRAGAAGYLLKDVSSETLVSAIQAATRGESFLQSTVTGRVVAAFARLIASGGAKAEALVLAGLIIGVVWLIAAIQTLP